MTSAALELLGAVRISVMPTPMKTTPAAPVPMAMISSLLAALLREADEFSSDVRFSEGPGGSA